MEPYTVGIIVSCYADKVTDTYRLYNLPKLTCLELENLAFKVLLHSKRFAENPYVIQPASQEALHTSYTLGTTTRPVSNA